MPGIACHFKTLELTLGRMTGAADLTGVRDVMIKNPEWAHLGALGPALMDFVPGTRATNPLLDAWSQVFSLVGDGMLVDKGLLSILRDIDSFFTTVEPIVAAEDLQAISNVPDATLNIVNTVGPDLQKIFDNLPLVIFPVGVDIMSKMRPVVNVPVNSPVPPSRFWEIRHYLHWKKSGKFVRNLYLAMRDSGDERFLAYAYGYLMAYALNVVGAPFVSSSVGAPMRTHWWRTRWINNYVDAWVWGFYESSADMQGGDDPAPPYTSWANLCDANLQERIGMAAHDPNDIMQRLYNGTPLSDDPILPPAFGELWVDAFNKTYNPSQEIGGLTPGSLDDAYLMAWLILWFQTSPSSLGCNSAPDASPPDDCGNTPAWTNPEVEDNSGTPNVPVPPAPEIEEDADEAKIISGILLALLGIGLLFTGNLSGGGQLIYNGIKDIIEGANEINWGKLRCWIWWYKLYLYHSLDALHEIMTVAAFRYPNAGELASDIRMPTYFGDWVDPYDSGKQVVRSRREVAPDSLYPAPEWTTGFNWMNRPTGIEQPATTAYRVVAYPSFFVDDGVSNPLANGDVKTAGTWPARMTMTAAGLNGEVVQFGNAVDNAMDLYRHLGDQFPDWNLDGDRGLAYHTWEFQNGVYLSPAAIQPES